MRLQPGDHGIFSYRPVYRDTSGGRVRDTTLRRARNGNYYALKDTDRKNPLTINRWIARVSVRGYDGKIRRVQGEGPTRTEADRALRAKVQAMLDAGHVPTEIAATTTVAALMDYHLETLEKRGRAAATLDTYRRISRTRIVPALGALQLREVTVGRMQAFIDTIAETSGPTSARMTRALLVQAWKTADRHDAVTSNVPARTLPVPVESKRTTAPTWDQVKAIVEAVTTSTGPVPPARPGGRPGVGDIRGHAHRRATDLADPIIMLAGTGLRVSEVFGLYWSDVDLVEGTVTVAARVVEVEGGLIRATGAKSIAGQRTIKVPERVRTMLLERSVEGARPGLLVFPSDTGGLRAPGNFRKQWNRIRPAIDAAGVSPHDFRRSVATRMRDEGLPEHVITDYLGHETIATADDHYFVQGRADDRPAETIAL